jgi:allantoate deiminase
MIRELGEIGADSEGGVSRLAMTAEERKAHELVGTWLRELGLSVATDPFGNTLATRKGSSLGAPAIAFGSHLDTVYHGGRFDGAAGVVAMVEVMRLLSEAGVTTSHPLLGVVFTSEEGARFGEPCMGSKAVAGLWRGRDLNQVRDAEGTSLADAMRAVGLDPGRVDSARWDSRHVAAYLELHIEQARLLEVDGVPIGLVDMVAGSTRLLMQIQGRADHSGATPMGARADALAAASEIVLVVESVASDVYHRGTRATVGRLNVHPNSLTTIPGRVVLTVDVRDTDGDRQRRTAAEIVERAVRICRHRGVRLLAEVIADTSPTVLSTWLRRLVMQSCRDLNLGYRVMSSGASHDAQVIARIAPAAMILVPSRQGLSHVPEEWTNPVDIARGVNVLARTVLYLDRVPPLLPDRLGNVE